MMPEAHLTNHNIWHISVGELIEIFKESLLAIIPTLEKAHISWRDSDSYDDWDEIAGVIYKNIIVRSLEFHFTDANAIVKFPSYGMIYPNYTEMSFIDVSMQEKGDSLTYNAFIGFATSKEPFDMIHVITINKNGQVIGTGGQYLEWGKAKFCLQHRLSATSLTEVKDLYVQL